MKLLITTVAILILSFTVNVSAKTVSDVEIAESIPFEDKTLLARGAGIRSKFFIDLYVASLFSEEYIDSSKLSATDSYKVIHHPNINAIRLNIVSGLITSQRMLDSIEQGFELATDGKSKEIDAHIIEFISVFDSPIKKQDQFTFISEPGLGVHVLKNNKPLISINNEAFRQALLSIWLGSDPVDTDLQRDMFGY
ncbi:chalcone isomerase [Colwellia sp. 75C3]|uniref:chalcone isomerase family protein n=1 Tax=Colwellia sp. 75C3 TaxID=888425 RepID=UPI000C34EFB7|nr:chalcone isomerase family protein [Colwellia sp. 75C3]PKG80965.1 chalcone isomerase [Colwellia sp. 75C3]